MNSRTSLAELIREPIHQPNAHDTLRYIHSFRTPSAVNRDRDLAGPGIRWV